VEVGQTGVEEFLNDEWVMAGGQALYGLYTLILRAYKSFYFSLFFFTPFLPWCCGTGIVHMGTCYPWTVLVGNGWARRDV
jgi:hypothetical protein